MDVPAIPQEQARAPGDRVLDLIRREYPDYHPLVALVRLAHKKDVDERVELECHRAVAKYVQPELKALEISGNISETRRVIVSLFDEGDSPEGSSAPGLPDLEGDAMLLLDSPAVTVADDPMWHLMTELAHAA